jgi:hypothetical protein
MQIVQDCMSIRLLRLFISLVSLATLFGCGDNIESPEPSDAFGPPQDLKALSVNDSSVSLQWSAALGASDSLFQGYIVQWDSNQDSVSKATLSYKVDSLSPGQKEFMVRSFRTDGQVSVVAVIRWAPAARFDSIYTVFENSSSNSVRPEGYNVGTRTTDPSVMIIDLTNSTVLETIDFYFSGGSGQISQPLAMSSARVLFGSLNQTLFSSVTHSSSSLDFPLSSFPDAGSFTKDTIAVSDNTIYYARVIGDPGETNYARIHLHVSPGTAFPDRVIEVQVSLQRVPDLLFALKRPTETYSPRGLAVELANPAFLSLMDLQPIGVVF